MGRHVANGRGLTGGVRRVSWGPSEVSGGRVGVAGCRPSFGPGDLTPRPGAPEVDRVSWTTVPGPRPLEQMEHVLRAVSRPNREQAVMVVR
jgi:hypothetical protein